MSIDAKKIVNLMSIASALIAGIAASISFSTFDHKDKPIVGKDDNINKIVQRFQREQDAYDKLGKLEKEVNQLSSKMESLSSISVDQKVSSSIKELKEKYGKDEKRISKIEEVVLADPAKALNLVLLKNDIETMKKTIELQREFSKQDVDRIYTQNQWLMGTLIALALSIIGLVVPNFLKKNNVQNNDNA